MGGRTWSTEEDRALRAAVSRVGVRWRRISCEPALVGRSATAVRLRWVELAAYPPAAPPTAVPPQPFDGAGGTFPWECRVAYQRPWSHHVFRSTVASRRPSKRQRALISLWGLDEPGSEMLLCNLSLAEDRVRSHLKRTCSRPYSNALLLSTALTVQERDELGLAYRARDVCHTMTCANSNLYWVCCPGGRCGFATSTEISRFMGGDPSGCVAAMRRAGVCESRRHAWLAESIPLCMARECARLALSHVLAAQCPAVWRCGSLFSGARDAFTLGMRAVADMQCVFVAESDAEKRSVLRATSSPVYEYGDARSASRGCPHVHCLSATPSCRRASRANHAGDPAVSDAALVSDFELVADTARRAQPLVLLLEQSDGLRTHHPNAYDAMCRVLDALPYVWAHRSMDLHDDLGGCHLRCRLLWVGVRSDVFVK